MSLEDVIKRKLEEQKKTELMLKKLDAQKNAEQPTQNKDGAKWYEGYFQAGDALKNGYDKGDISKTVVGTEADVFTNLVKGVVGWGESAVDAGAVALGNVAANFGNQEFATKMGEFAKKDLYDEEAVARQILKIAPVLAITNPGTFIGAHMANAAVRLDDWLSMKEEDDGAGGKITVKKDNSILGEKTGGLISSTGEMFVKQAANRTGVPIGSLITAVTVYGSQAEQALKEGATAQQAHWSAAISAGAEIIFERMSGGIKLGGVPMDEALRKQISNSIAPVAIKNLLNLGLDVGGEAGEEFLTEFFTKLGTALYKKEDLADILFSPQALNDYIDAVIGGGLMGGAFNVPNAVVGTATGRDYKTGRNENEQTVIDKLYKDRVAAQEKDGKKLTTKEKGKILDAVELEYERGEIAVEDIEAALGGDSYKKYTEMTKQQKDLQAEFDQLNSMKKSDMTGAQEDRLQELRQQLATMKQEDAAGKLKKQYLQETMEKVTGSHLEESYNQYNQRSEYFQADLEKYDEKQRAIVQKAVDSGILNNTRKTHDFVDLVAKIGAETGTDFDFTDNKKLAESGFAVDGVTVNGFTDGKTVTVNIHSAKALNTVVGHEIMHVLEGTEMAGKLQEKLFAYAESKGELAKRRGDLEKLYAGRDANIDSELAADLVGDYIFSDIEFVRSLKAGDRNLFQKIYDEIKHLVKLATAGSKEARELEKVKKLFADVYREAGAEKSTAKDGGVSYSISYTTDNRPVAVIDGDIFNGKFEELSESERVKIVKNAIKKFRPGIPVAGRLIGVTRKTAEHFANSDYTDKLRNHDQDLYKDKASIAQNIDDVVYASTNYINEALKHPRKDNITQFAKGAVLLEIGGKQYEADVLVGYTTTKEMVLYDVQDLTPTSFIIKEKKAQPTLAGNDSNTRKTVTPSTESISDSNTDVKRKYSISEVADRAVIQFGTTTDFNEAGFILPNGEMLRFTDDNHKGERQYDHRAIGLAYGEKIDLNVHHGFNEASNKHLEDFVENGGIRFDPGSLEFNMDAGMQLSSDTPITAAQEQAIRDFIEWKQQREEQYNADDDPLSLYRGPLALHIDFGGNANTALFAKAKDLDAWGRKHLTYEGGQINADRIIADIRHYYRTGETKKPSMVAQFHYSLSPEADRAYMDAVENANMDAAQKMVEKAAKETGYTVKAYHGTDAGEFHEFDKGRIGEASGLSILGDGFYFSDRESTAKQYGKNVFPVYLKQMNPYVATAEDAYRLNALELERQGYDSVILQTGKGKVLMVLDPNQVKSAAPVTYDENGNVIPLSERFNPKSNDMRYSLSQEQMEAADTAYDPKQIYGKDVRMEAPVAEQTKTGVAGIEGPLPDQMPKAQPIEGPLREEVKAAPAMEAPTAAEMPKAQTVEAPVQEAKREAVETKAPKDGMEPVVSPKVYRPDEGKLKPKAEDMSQEEREYRDSMEDKPAETFRDVMEKRLQSLRREIEENRRNKQTVAEQYDEKIQSLKDEFVALKNKNTKHAQDTLRSISRNQQLKETRMAEYDKRINDLTKRVQRTQERIDSDTGRADWKQGKLDKIDAKYEEELEALETRQKEQRRELETRTASKEQYFADRALELYDELSTLKKGVKASEDLAYFLDRGHTWNAIKSALLLVKDKPSGIANPHFGLEKIVRERLEQRYNDALAELADLDTQQAMDRKALEDAMKKEKATLQASQIKKTKMEQYQAESAELAGNTATWKDKKTGFGYSMQTMRRYLREVVRDENGNPDIARADAIYEYLQGTYNQNEAALKREAKKRKDQIRELGLNKYEDEYGAMLGELKYNPESQSDAELAYRAEEFLEAHKDKIDLEKTNKAIETLRSEYDELIELLNNALREQGFREIPYRKGYFPHFMEPSQNFVQKLLNWKPKNNEIPTSIAGMTEEFNPQRSWQGFDKERKGNATVYSLQKGYNQYLDGALDWIYHIADIQRRRAFENHIREVHTDENARKRIDEIRDSDQYDAEDAQAQIESVLAEKKNPLNNLVVELRRGTNTLAGKKSSMDRSVEADFGRWVYSTMTNVANRSSANMVAGNLASAATNVIPIVQSWTQVKPRNSFKAVKQIIQAMNNDDGLVEKSAFLTNRLLQNESLYKDAWDKIGDVVSLPMEAVDKFTSQVVWRSKYIENIEKGMSEEAAIHDADQFAENVIAGRSRGNMPTIFDSKNPIYKVLTAFQLEVANQYGYFFKDVPTDTKAAMKGMTEKQKNEEKTKLAIGLTNMLLGTYVYNAAMEFITGNTPATDPIRILEGIIRDIWGEAEDDDEEEMGEEIANVAGSALEELAKELPYIGGLIGGGRISSAAAIPYGDPFKMIKGTMEDFGEGDWANLKKEWLNLVYYGVLPMGGGQIKKINEGIGMYLDPSEEFPFLPKIAETPGSYTTSGNLRYAVEPTFWNVLQSILFGQYANANAREYFDEGRSPLSPNQVEEFSSVDMSMSEYWDYRDALKAAGDKVADKIDVVMDLDLPIAQKNILANNIADRKDPIDLTGAEDFGNFAEFDFYSQNPEKYKFLNNHGISWNSYTGLSAEEKDAVDKLFNAPKKTEFLLKKGITAAQWKDMDEEAREELNFEYNSPEKYSFLQKAGISVEQYKGFDKATRNAWDTMAENPKKYEFLKKQGVTVDQYKMFNDGWKEAWNWAYKEQDGYLLSKGVTDDLYAYRKYMDKIAGISGDKNEKGNTISGSKKKKVWAYIQTLPLSDGAKMLLFKEKYPDDDTYNKEVARYVLSLAMTYTEKKRILERLKFKVDSNGKITW